MTGTTKGERIAHYYQYGFETGRPRGGGKQERKSLNMPSEDAVQKLLFDFCTMTRQCIGLAEGHDCPPDCPVHMAKLGIEKGKEVDKK